MTTPAIPEEAEKRATKAVYDNNPGISWKFAERCVRDTLGALLILYGEEE